MTAPDQQGPTLADIALNDLAAQVAEYARKLSVLRAQYQQLVQFVDSKADVLGLTRSDASEVEAPESQVNGSAVVDKASNSRE